MYDLQKYSIILHNDVISVLNICIFRINILNLIIGNKCLNSIQTKPINTKSHFLIKLKIYCTLLS